jgi:hypothetical protein
MNVSVAENTPAVESAREYPREISGQVEESNPDAETARNDLHDVIEFATRNSRENTLRFHDMKRAANFEVWKRAAEQGISEGQVLLGMCYLDGIGVPQDRAMGALWYRRAAEQGFIEAQKRLAECYRGGVGVPRDLEQAENWLRKAAEQELAALRKAAEHGDVEAMQRLAWEYEERGNHNGTAKPQSKNLSKNWRYFAKPPSKGMLRQCTNFTCG